jgi:hypothetical protein
MRAQLKVLSCSAVMLGAVAVVTRRFPDLDRREFMAALRDATGRPTLRTGWGCPRRSGT